MVALVYLVQLVLGNLLPVQPLHVLVVQRVTIILILAAPLPLLVCAVLAGLILRLEHRPALLVRLEHINIMVVLVALALLVWLVIIVPAGLV